MKHLGLTALGLYSLAGSANLLQQGPPTWHPGALQCTPETTRTEARSIDTDVIMLRQNPCVDSEANLVYVLVGARRVLLIDTGAVEGAAAAALVEWVQLARRAELARRDEKEGDGPLPLLVVHTHGHQDHRAGDAAFAALPGTEIIAAPTGTLDLGDREVVVIPAPGHHPDHVVFYDGQSRSLFTGDFLLRGRLLVDDLDAYRESAQRVADFVKTHPVENVLGAHIELDITGKPFPAGATFHPNERTRPLTIFDVYALPAALSDFNGFYSTYPNFIVVNPIHNLIAVATGAIAAIVLLVWLTRRLLKRRRAARVTD